MRQHFCDVDHALVLTLSFQSTLDMHQATGIGNHKSWGTGGFQIADLPLQEFGG